MQELDEIHHLVGIEALARGTTFRHGREIGTLCATRQRRNEPNSFIRRNRNRRREDPQSDRDRGRSVLNDLSIRLALRSRLLAEHAGQADTVLLQELGLCRGRVRVDIAVVNGSLSGYEIKSDRDTLRRLATQIDFYGKVLDQATLVVGSRFLAETLDLMPRWWGVLGVIETEDGIDFRTIRCAQKNPQRSARALAELLWLEHALALLEHRNAARGVRGKPRRFVWDRVCECFDVDEIAEAVRARLKARATLQASA